MEITDNVKGLHRTYKAVNLSKKITFATNVTLANTWASRLFGLLPRKQLELDEALWLVPCNSIHTWGMRFIIDVVFLDADQKVVESRPSIHPWRMIRPIIGASSVLEGAEGMIHRGQLEKGVRVALEVIKESNKIV